MQQQRIELLDQRCRSWRGASRLENAPSPRPGPRIALSRAQRVLKLRSCLLYRTRIAATAHSTPKLCRARSLQAFKPASIFPARLLA